MRQKKTSARRAGALILMVGAGSAFAPHFALADTPDEQYKYASELYSNKLYGLSSQKLKEFLDANPNHPQAKIAAYQYAAAIYRTDKDKKGPDYAAAAAAYEGALQKYTT